MLDLNNTASAKIARAIDTVLKPLLDAGGKYDGQVKVILRPQVQPWHASSTLTHEAALAVCHYTTSVIAAILTGVPTARYSASRLQISGISP